MAAPEPAPEQGPGLPVMVGGVLLLVLLLAGGWTLVSRARQPDVAASPAPPASAVEQLEAAVADDPDDLVARRALADRYFEADRFDKALEHYLVVLEARPQDPPALARSGWIAYEGGDAATGERLVTESLEVRPEDPEALWYLAQIRLYGLDDPQGAVLPLRTLLDRDDLGRGFRNQVRELLAAARR